VRMKRKLVIAAVVCVTLVILVALGVVLLRIGLDGRPGPESQLTYPIEWDSARQPDPVQTDSSTLVLNEDGTANIVNIKVGETSQTADGRQCVRNSENAFSGNGTWEVDPDGALRITTNTGDAVFLPSRARFEGADWSELRQPFCDLTYADFNLLN
jgi:hypothetical protein